MTWSVEGTFRRLRDSLMTYDPDRSTEVAAEGEKVTLPAAADHGASLALKVIATLMIFYTLYFAASLVLPVVVALLLSMLITPAVSLLERMKMPRAAAAIVTVLTTVALLAFGASLLSAPAQYWIERIPYAIARIQTKTAPIMRPLQRLSEVKDQLQGVAPLGEPAEHQPQAVVLVRSASPEIIISTPHILAPVLSVFILTFSFLTAGDVFLRKLVTIIPTFKEKKRTVEIIRAIENDIIYYLTCFATINIILGAAMGAVTWLLGIPDPMLWAVLVAVLNFIPYIGGVASMCVLGLVGFATFDTIIMAIAAPGIMMTLSVVSSTVITPLVLGRRLRLNPVAIFLAIMLWGWMWGPVGVLLAVPLLASFKIICERIEPLATIAEFLTEYTRPDEEGVADLNPVGTQAP